MNLTIDSTMVLYSDEFPNIYHEHNLTRGNSQHVITKFYSQPINSIASRSSNARPNQPVKLT